MSTQHGPDAARAVLPRRPAESGHSQRGARPFLSGSQHVHAQKQEARVLLEAQASGDVTRNTRVTTRRDT